MNDTAGKELGRSDPVGWQRRLEANRPRRSSRWAVAVVTVLAVLAPLAAIPAAAEPVVGSTSTTTMSSPAPPSESAGFSSDPTSTTMMDESTTTDQPTTTTSTAVPDAMPSPLPAPTSPTPSTTGAPSSSSITTTTVPAPIEPAPSDGRPADAATPSALPVPDDLWDIDPGIPGGKTYVAIEMVPNGPPTAGESAIYTNASSRLSFSSFGDSLDIGVVLPDSYWHGHLVGSQGVYLLQPGYLSEAQVSWRGSGSTCGDRGGWIAIDDVRFTEGGVSYLRMRFEQQCAGRPALHGEVQWVPGDMTTPPGPPAAPDGLWDASPPLPPGQSYVVMQPEPGEPISAGQNHLYTKVGSRIHVEESGKELRIAVDGQESWSGILRPMEHQDGLEVGYYGDARSIARPNPLRGQFFWSGEGRSCNALGWFAVDRIERVKERVVKLRARIAYTCDSSSTLFLKIDWSAADATAPPGPLPIPQGLWDVAPPGTDPTTTYVYVEGADGDVMTGGKDFFYTADDARFSFLPFGPYFRNALHLWVVGDSDVWHGYFEPTYNLRSLRAGYYPNSEDAWQGNPARPGLSWNEGTQFCDDVAGWFAIDRIEWVNDTVTAFVARFAQSCDGGPTIHGKIHIVPARPPAPSPPPALSRPAGPPFGSLDVALPTVGGIGVSGWVIDPDTAAPIPVHVYVDGQGTALTASGARGDVEAAFAGYGPLHGFSAVVPASGGVHQVCAYGINVGSGANSLIGCKQVTVPSGSPFGALDVAAGEPGLVLVAGWAIDRDVASPIDVHVYVDGVGVATTANGDRPDVGVAFGYGPSHGFGARVPMGAGPHTVCVYGINVGLGDNSLLGCRQVTVPGGAPFGALDVAVPSAGGFRVAGWAIDPDTTAPIEVHVYVDGSGVATTANGSRPDVAAVFPPYGSAHGYDVNVPAATGTHQVCAYGINVATGSNSLIGCRAVTVG